MNKNSYQQGRLQWSHTPFSTVFNATPRTWLETSCPISMQSLAEVFLLRYPSQTALRNSPDHTRCHPKKRVATRLTSFPTAFSTKVLRPPYRLISFSLCYFRGLFSFSNKLKFFLRCVTQALLVFIIKSYSESSRFNAFLDTF